jgi:hypothetical protein
VAITVSATGLPAGQSAFLTVDEMAGSEPLNGFGAGVRAASLDVAIRESLAFYRSTVERLEAGFKVKPPAPQRPKPELPAAAYVELVHQQLVPYLKSALAQLGAPGNDSFGLEAELAAAGAQKSAPELVSNVATLLNGVDAYLTMLQLDKGDVADIQQMVRWQKDLFRKRPKLAQLACAPKLVEASNAFLHGRSTGKLTNRAYPQLLKEVSGCLHEAGGAPIEFASTDLAALQKEHRASLLVLSKP